MRKIMFMTNSLIGGGAEKILQTLISHLNYNKYDVTLYSMHRENIARIGYPEQIHYKVIFDNYTGKNSFFRIISNVYEKIKGKCFQFFPSRVFYRLFIRGKYDVEVAFIEGESTKIISGSSNRTSKKYAWVHTDLQQNPWTSFLYQNDKDESAHYKEFDKILCVSQSVRNSFLMKFSDIESIKVQVQYNPINQENILAMSKCEVEKAIGEKKRIRLIAVGRLVEQKGFDRLLQVCAMLRQDGYEFELLILGEGCERDKLEAMIDSLNLRGMVFLLGFLSNPYAVMATGDLLVCSSRVEGFSTVLTEGVVLGLPIISTDCAGVRELFGNLQCGKIVENMTEELYVALRDVLDNPGILYLYRKGSLERGKNFEFSKTMTEVERLLDM